MSAVLPTAGKMNSGTGAAHTVAKSTAAPAVTAPVPPATPSPGDLSTAADRLALSRERLRGAMIEITHPPKRPSALGDNVGPMARALFRKAQGLPGAGIVLESLGSWWRQHPLRTLGIVAEAGSRRLLRPIADRNPQSLLLGAAAIGALLVFSRPWRWILRPALFIGLLPQLTKQVLKRMPVESWVTLAANVMSRSAGPRAAGAVTRSSHRASDLP